MELKLCSLVAVGTGSVAKIAGNFRAFGKRPALQTSKALIALVGRVAISCFFHFSFQRIISETMKILLLTSCWYNSNKLSVSEEDISVTEYLGIKFQKIWHFLFWSSNLSVIWTNKCSVCGT